MVKKWAVLSMVILATLQLSQAATSPKVDFKHSTSQRQLAVIKNELTPKLSLSEVQMNQLIMALRLPKRNRMTAIRSLPAWGLRGLELIAFNEHLSLQVQWRALITMAKVYGKLSLPALKKALQSKKWYMRNVGIIAISQVDREIALKWAGRLLDDKSLVVRTAAVKVIAQLKGLSMRGQLWNKMYSKDNYKNGESLWIRKHIAQTLSMFASYTEVADFVKLLSDSDAKVHPYAVQALENIVGSSQIKADATIDQKRTAWMLWWNQRSQSLL